LPPKEIVYGAEFEGNAKAYAEDDVASDKVINDAVGGVPIVVVWDSGLKTVKIFERTLGGETLTFKLSAFETFDKSGSEDGKLIDDSKTIIQTEILDNNGKKWTIEEMSEKLEIVDTFGHFWFAWTAFFPQTDVYNT
jgi:hypothetical protein